MRSLTYRLLVALLAIAATGVVASVVVSLVPLWPLSLFEHFRVQYVAVGLLVLAGCGLVGLRGWFDATAIALLAHLLWLVPDLSRSPRHAARDGAPLRVLLLNVLSSNTRFDAVRELIRDSDADVVALLEIQDSWLRELAPALTGYGSRIEHSRRDNFGLALYARGSFGGEVQHVDGIPSIVGTLQHADRRIGIVLVHPIPPVSAGNARRLPEQLIANATRGRTSGDRQIMLGDFNATPWSRPFRALLAASGLCDTRAGFGLQATFPAMSAFLRIPIDHVLASCDIGVRARRVERDVGSDHLPVVVDLLVP